MMDYEYYKSARNLCYYWLRRWHYRFSETEKELLVDEVIFCEKQVPLTHIKNRLHSRAVNLIKRKERELKYKIEYKYERGL